MYQKNKLDHHGKKGFKGDIWEELYTITLLQISHIVLKRDGLWILKAQRTADARQ